MPQNPITPNYNCGQSDLYATLELAWDNCSEDQASMVLFKSKYTPLFISDRLAEILLAKQLPSFQVRDAITETDHANLVFLAPKTLSNFRILKRYIDDAFLPHEIKPQEEAAGQTFYETAAADNWKDYDLLGTAMTQYITANKPKLLADGFMPVGFPAIVDADFLEWQTLWAKFRSGEADAGTLTQNKIVANNVIYKKTTDMQADGVENNTADFALQQRYVWTTLLGIITTPGASGARGKINNATTFDLIPTVTISFQKAGEPAITIPSGADSKYNAPLSAGHYRVAINHPSFLPFTSEIDITTGTTSTFNFSLTPQ